MESVLDDQSYPFAWPSLAGNDTASHIIAAAATASLDVGPSSSSTTAATTTARRKRRKLAKADVRLDSSIRYVLINYTDATTATAGSIPSHSNTTIRRRQGHLLVLLPLTQQSTSTELQQQRELVEFRVYVELAAFLAFQHVQHRSGFVLPRVQERIRDCDFQWTYEHADTQFSPMKAAKELMRSMGIVRSGAPQEQPQHQKHGEKPFALVGAARSVVTKTLATLAGALQLPQISSSSTASSLDATPFFARTIATNKVDAWVLIAYLRLHLNLDHVGVLYLEDTWGRQYQQDLSLYAMRYNIVLHAVPYQATSTAMVTSDVSAIDVAMQQVRQTPVRFWIGIIDPNDWKPVVRAAYQWGVMGNPDYQWYFGDMVALRENTFFLDATTEQDLAVALHGIGMPFWNIPKHAAFEQALATVAQDPQFLLDFIAHHDEPYLFDNFTFAKTPPTTSLYQYLTYDAVMALGITACETPGLFTGEEFYNKLLEIDFEGVSGRVKLDPKTGTRLADGVVFDIINFLLNDNTFGNGDTNSTNIITFEARTSATIALSSVPHNWTAQVENQGNSIAGITIVKPFVFHNNGTNPPMALPPPEHDMNLIPPGLRAFGISLGVLVMILSIGFAIWTMIHREAYVVRAAQPIFLIMICVGTGIVSFTIIPLSFQEDMPLQLLDLGCASIPWTLSVGYIVAIASLYSKARRVNKVMQSRRGHKVIRRVRINPTDVIWPAFTLLHTDVGVLIAWTFSPFRLVWTRTFDENHVDSMGRLVESYGACRPGDGTAWYLLFVIPLYLTKLLVLVRATYASYQGRHLPTEFGETQYLFLALLSLCETSAVGAIPLLAVMNDPTSFFMVASIFIVMGCLSVLLPIFVPKYLQRHVQEPKGRKNISLMRTSRMVAKYAWRQPEPQRTSEDADFDSHRSQADSHLSQADSHRSLGRVSSAHIAANLSVFLASEPIQIKRISATNSNSSKDLAPHTSRASDALTAVGHVGYKLLTTPAVVAKAIILAPFSSSLESSDDHTPHRLEALLEESENEETPADGFVGQIAELSDDGSSDGETPADPIVELSDGESGDNGTPADGSVGRIVELSNGGGEDGETPSDDYVGPSVELSDGRGSDKESPGNGSVGPMLELSEGGSDNVANNHEETRVADPSSLGGSEWSRTSPRDVVEQHMTAHEAKRPMDYVTTGNVANRGRGETSSMVSSAV